MISTEFTTRGSVMKINEVVDLQLDLVGDGFFVPAGTLGIVTGIWDDTLHVLFEEGNILLELELPELIFKKVPHRTLDETLRAIEAL